MYNSTAGLSFRVDVGHTSILLIVIVQPVLGVGFQYLNDIPNQVRKLLVQLDLLDVLTDPLALSPGFVIDPLDVTAEYAYLIVN